MSEVEIFEGHGGDDERLFIETILTEQDIRFVTKSETGGAEQVLGWSPYRIFVMADDVERALEVLADVDVAELELDEEAEEDPWRDPFATNDADEDVDADTASAIGDTGVPIAARRGRFLLWLAAITFALAAFVYLQFDDTILALIPTLVGGGLLSAYLRS